MVATKPTLSIFTGTKNLGRVFREQNQINVKFIEGNIPLSDTSGNTAVNWKGKTRFVMVQGAHDGTGFDGTDANGKLSDFIYEMEQWVRGRGNFGYVQEAITYTDSFGVDYEVKCFDWTWTRSFSDPNRIIWSLMLHEV
jgi:hypothetical protein